MDRRTFTSSAPVRSFKSSRVCRLERCEIHSSSVDEKRSCLIWRSVVEHHHLVSKHSYKLWQHACSSIEIQPMGGHRIQCDLLDIHASHGINVIICIVILVTLNHKLKQRTALFFHKPCIFNNSEYNRTTGLGFFHESVWNAGLCLDPHGGGAWDAHLLPAGPDLTKHIKTAAYVCEASYMNTSVWCSVPAVWWVWAGLHTVFSIGPPQHSSCEETRTTTV